MARRWLAAATLGAVVLLSSAALGGAQQGYGTEVSASVFVFRLTELTGTEFINQKLASR